MNIAAPTDPTPTLYCPLRVPKKVNFWIGTLLGDAVRTCRCSSYPVATASHFPPRGGGPVRHMIIAYRSHD